VIQGCLDEALGERRSKREPATAANQSPNPAAPPELFDALLTPPVDRYKSKQYKDLFISVRLAETAFERVK
jgi:hypothetical protein